MGLYQSPSSTRLQTWLTLRLPSEPASTWATGFWPEDKWLWMFSILDAPQSPRRRFPRNWPRCTRLQLMSSRVLDSALTSEAVRPLDSLGLRQHGSSQEVRTQAQTCFQGSVREEEGFPQTAKGKEEQNEEGSRNQES